MVLNETLANSFRLSAPPRLTSNLLEENCHARSAKEAAPVQHFALP
jgi:hypothetical protein